MQYRMIWTVLGLTKRANAELTGNVVEITHFALGDANGNVAFEPDQAMEALVHEVYRRPVDTVAIDESNPAWVDVDGHILAADGGWWVREIGLFDADGDMVAVGNKAPFYKPLLAEGEGDDLYMRFILLTANTAVIQLKINPAIAMASRKYVDDSGPGWRASHVRFVTESGPVLPTDRIIIMKAVTAEIVMSMPSVLSLVAREVTFCRDETSVFGSAVQAAANETLPTGDGRQSLMELTVPDESVTVYPDGVSHWRRK